MKRYEVIVPTIVFKNQDGWVVSHQKGDKIDLDENTSAVKVMLNQKKIIEIAPEIKNKNSKK